MRDSDYGFQVAAGERIPFGPLTRSDFNWLGRSFEDPSQLGTQQVARERGIEPGDYHRVAMSSLKTILKGESILQGDTRELSSALDSGERITLLQNHTEQRKAPESLRLFLEESSRQSRV